MTPISSHSQAWSVVPEGGTGASRYLTPVLLDHALAFAAAGGAAGSVLTLPLETGLLVDELAVAVAGVSTGRTLVLGAAGLGYDWNGERDGLRVIQREALAGMLARCEAGDYLLLVEPRYWPLAGYDFASLVRQSCAHTGATWAVAIGQGGAGAQERVECDPQGLVRRVQRVYHPAGWSGPSAGTVVCAVVPARAMQGHEFESLSDLRGQLATRGLLTRDVPVLSDLADLREPASVLMLAEQTVDGMLRELPPAGMTLVRPGVLAASGCRIAESARLIGPIVLHKRVIIEAGATVVGPVLAGPGTRIGARAQVARCVLLSGSAIAAGTALCSEIVAGERTDTTAETDRPAEHRTVRALDSCVSRQMAVADLPRQQRSRRRRLELAIKRGSDALAAGLGLVALLPLLAVVAVLIKATSRGPLLFVHRREGQDGREFGCIKFRTMIAGAHRKQREMYDQSQVDGPQFKMDDDPRVTGLGRFLRKTNIDELPQLFNVLVGQMSLVGPRPSPFRENQICVAWRRARLSVRPGITGLWQICRDRQNDADFHQWIYYDLGYVKHFSLWLDAKILFWTIASRGGRRRVPLARLTGTTDKAPRSLQ